MADQIYQNFTTTRESIYNIKALQNEALSRTVLIGLSCTLRRNINYKLTHPIIQFGRSNTDKILRTLQIILPNERKNRKDEVKAPN